MSEKTVPSPVQEKEIVTKLIIGYRTRPVEGLETLIPEFKAPANYKSADKIAAYVNEKKEDFKLTAKDMPYSGTFDEVIIADPTKQRFVRYSHEASVQEERPPVSVRVRKYLMKYYKDAWTDDTHNRKNPQVIFVGFNMRNFVKILGLECSMPNIKRPCPLGMWYDNQQHRDIGEAVLPHDYKDLTLPFVLKRRRPIDPTEGKAWDTLIEDWNGPGQDPEQDVKIATELARQLGMLKLVAKSADDEE